MRSDFEKAFKSQYPHADYLACLKLDNSTNGYSLKNEVDKPDVNFWVCVGVNASWWAFQHQQSKVDELKLKLSEDSRILHNVIDIERKKNDELQKRVDAAQKLIQQWRDFETYSDDCANELEQALKGGNHESN